MCLAIDNSFIDFRRKSIDHSFGKCRAGEDFQFVRVDGFLLCTGWFTGVGGEEAEVEDFSGLCFVPFDVDFTCQFLGRALQN